MRIHVAQSTPWFINNGILQTLQNDLFDLLYQKKSQDPMQQQHPSIFDSLLSI